MMFDIKTEFNQALFYHKAGQLKKAGDKYRRIIKASPDHSDSLHLMGVIANQVGYYALAVGLIEKAIEINPKEPIYYNNVGNAFKSQGNLEKALLSYQKAIEIKPDFAEALVSLGSVYKELALLEEAIFCFKNALKFKENFADAYYNMAIVLKEQNRINEAIVCYKTCITINSGFSDAYFNLGAIYKESGRFAEAISCYEKALEGKPSNPDAYYNLGIAQQESGNLDEAIANYQQTVQLDPTYAKAYNNMGAIFKETGRPDKAIDCYEKSLQINPNAGIEIQMALLFPLIYESRKLILSERDRLSKQIEALTKANLTLQDPVKEVGTTSFYLAYQGLNNRDLQEKLANLYLRACPDLAWVSPQCSSQGTTGAKISIGIISRFFHEHTIGLLNLGIIKKLSRQKFHVMVFRFQKNEDALTKSIDKAADDVVILPNDLAGARQAIAGHPLDILFYPEIGMDPLTYFLAFARLAPVQCTTWGHPVTTGIPNMDYYLSSENAEPPDAQRYYSESLVLLKRFSMFCYRPEMPDKPFPREQFALSENCNLYVCPQTLFKFHPDFDEALGSILRRDPHGLLILFETKYGYLAKLLRNRFKRKFPDVMDRVRFLPRMPKKDFFSFLQIADVLLDTPHFTGGFTSLLAFAFGIPIVTWPGQFMCGRLTLGLYKQMGIMDCVADDAQSYADIANRLVNDKSWRNKIKNKILRNANVLYENIEAIHELEHFFERAVRGPSTGMGAAVNC